VEYNHWEAEYAENSMEHYLNETRRFRLLSGEEEKTLGRELELGRYLTHLETEYTTSYHRQPSAGEIFLALLKSFLLHYSLFNEICRQLHISPCNSVCSHAKSPELVQATGGPLDAKLVNAIAIRQRRVIELRFGLVDGYNWILRKISTKLGITCERVRQIENTALNTLRDSAIYQTLKDYI
jgi:hypothetical protein